MLLTVTRIRQLLVEGCMPVSLKQAITVGIGLFITVIGLKLSNIMTIKLSLPPATVDRLIAAHGTATPQSFETMISMGNLAHRDVSLSLIGLLLMGILMARKVKGAMLIGILTTTVLAIAMGEVKIPAAFTPVSMPDFTHNAFLALDIAGALHMGLLTIIFTFTFVELFDTMGTWVATASKAGLSDEQGKLPRDWQGDGCGCHRCECGGAAGHQYDYRFCGERRRRGCRRKNRFDCGDVRCIVFGRAVFHAAGCLDS